MLNDYTKRQTEEPTNAREPFWRRINISALMTNFHSANICIVRIMHQTQGWALSRLLICLSHLTPKLSDPTQLSQSASPPISTISFWLYFPMNRKHGSIFTVVAPPSFTKRYLAMLEEICFLNTFDVKTLNLILHIADLWPTVVGNNYQLAT